MPRTFGLLAAILVLRFTGLSTCATDYTWNNPTGGSWNVAANWNPSVIPSGSNTATIALTPGNPYIVQVPTSISIGGLNILSPDATVSVAADKILNYGNSGLVVNNGGTLAFGTNASMKNFSQGNLYFQNGAVTGAPKIDLTQNSTFEIGSAQEFVGNFTVNLRALATVSGFLGAAVSLTVEDDQLLAGRNVFIDKSDLNVTSARFENFATITFSPESDPAGGVWSASIEVDVDPSDGVSNQAGTLVNHGSIFVNSGDATASFFLEFENTADGIFDAAERVNFLPNRLAGPVHHVNQGTMNLGKGGLIVGNFENNGSIDWTGSLQIVGGTFVNNGIANGVVAGNISIDQNSTVQLGEANDPRLGILAVSSDKVVDVQSGGLIAGNGTVIAGTLLVSNGTLRPGFSVGRVDVEANYQQDVAGTLLIDVTGAGTNLTSDTVNVTGEVRLGGTLVLDASQMTNPGESIVIMTSVGGLIAGSKFDSVVTTGSDGIYFYVGYSTNAVTANPEDRGNFNHDDMIDEADAELFAIGLINPQRFSDLVFAAASSAADIDHNGWLDFDDIDNFAALMTGTGNSLDIVMAAIERQQALVPEPSTVVLTISGGFWLLGLFSRRPATRFTER